MKRIVLVLLAFSLNACVKKEEAKTESTVPQKSESQKSAPKLEEWTELETFHNIMAETFHPMEEGDMKPIMTRAQEMEDKAKTWQSSKMPARYEPIKDSVYFYLGKLVLESQSLGDMVSKKAKEEDIKKNLTALHDRFHAITALCYGLDKELKKKMQQGN